MIRRGKPKLNPDQLDLFAPRAELPPLPPPKPPRSDLVLMRQVDGYYRFEPCPPDSPPTSRWTRGGLCAIEALRVLSRLSIDIGGLLMIGEAWCPECVRFLFHGWNGVRLYKAERDDGAELAGEQHTCTRCHRTFTAHADEHHRAA